MDNNFQSYFGKNEKIYIFKCKKCGFKDPVPAWLIGEICGFNLFAKLRKKTPEMECPMCHDTMIPEDFDKKKRKKK